MPIEVTPPKYVQIVNAIQARIEGGTYAPGAMIPSESDLMREFGASRPIVVRSLDLLRQDGWIESRQGKGRFVIGAPIQTRGRHGRQAYMLLDGPETAGTTVLSAGPVLAPMRAAVALGVDEGTPLIARRRVAVVDGLGPVELGTTYVPVESAAGTNIAGTEPLREGILRHLAGRNGLSFDHATERLSAKLPTAEEARLLDVSRREPVLSVMVVVCDRQTRPLVAVDLVIPSSRHELEDTFSLS